MNFINFFEQFLRNPAQTGAVVASSTKLCQLMVEEAGVHNAQIVMEFGTGTGSVTSEILRQKQGSANFIGFEINETFAEATRKRCPGAEIISACATTAVDVLQQRQLQYCDAIVSGLPWAAFSIDLQQRLLTAANDVLRPGGTFVTFAYVHGRPLHSARRFQRQLNLTFPVVKKSEIVWGNVPPAMIYIARK